MPTNLLEKQLVFSRVKDAGKEYVQDRMRTEGTNVAALLKDPNTYMYICGLKDMEAGVEEALADIARKHGMDWSEIKPTMRSSGRYHVETY